MTLRSQLAAYNAGPPTLPAAQGLRADYVAGRIEIDEYEAQLDALLAKDPEALDRKDALDIKWGPGSAIPIRGNPADMIWPDSRLIAAAARTARRQGLSHKQTVLLLRTVKEQARRELSPEQAQRREIRQRLLEAHGIN